MIRSGGRLTHLFVLALVFSSCTCGQEEPPPPAPIPPTRPAGFHATVAATVVATATPAAEATGTPAAESSPTSSVALPADFPDDIAIMEGSTLAGIQQLGGGANNVLFSTEEPAAKVFEYYKDNLKEKGHDVTQQYQTSEQSFLSFKRGDRVTNVVVAKDPNDPSKRIVAIMYYEEDPAEEF
jgi:hypothetical protein